MFDKSARYVHSLLFERNGYGQREIVVIRNIGISVATVRLTCDKASGSMGMTKT